MLVYSSCSLAYTPLLLPLFFSLCTQISTGHSISILILTGIFSIGVWQQSYYNMAISTILAMIALAANLQEFIVFAQKSIEGSFGNTVVLLFGNFYVLGGFVEAVVIVVVGVESVRKFRKFSVEAYQAAEYQW